MQTTKPKATSETRSGYTLLEVLMVVAVTMALVGLAWPAMLAVQRQNLLNEAAENVRGKLAGTRMRAINAGLAYQFRYEPEGRNYLVLPYADDAFEADTENSTESTSNRFAGKLPEESRFEADDTENMETQSLDVNLLRGLGNSTDLSQASWSPPLIFYPDGSAVDAEFSIVDSRKNTVRFSLRGLTGAVKMAPLRREDSR